MSIYRKLQDARIQLQGMKLAKTGYNSFAKYYYFELGDFLPSIQQIFSDIGLCGVVSFGPDLATLRIIDIEDEKEIIITSPLSSAELKGCHPIQNVGACELYSRRYLWVAAMEIVEHDAIDNQPLDAPTKSAPAAPSKPSTAAPQASQLSEDEMDTVCMAMEESGDFESLKSIFGPGYKKASPKQQAALTKTYNGIKAKNKWA